MKAFKVKYFLRQSGRNFPFVFGSKSKKRTEMGKLIEPEEEGSIFSTIRYVHIFLISSCQMRPGRTDFMLVTCQVCGNKTLCALTVSPIYCLNIVIQNYNTIYLPVIVDVVLKSFSQHRIWPPSKWFPKIWLRSDDYYRSYKGNHFSSYWFASPSRYATQNKQSIEYIHN